MRRSPFFSHANLPRSFYVPAEAPYYRPHRPSGPRSTPPSSTLRSVINVPVFDPAPSPPSSSPPQPRPVDPHSSSPPPFNTPTSPLINSSSAATIIQSHFRGFYVRRHRPLLHLRSIAKACKQLEDLQAEVESPGFPLKVRASEKERLQFSESVMSIILRLDAIEGSLAEVRSQRKEATKMAVKLQDAADAIMMQKDEIVDLNPTDNHLSEGGMVTDDNGVSCEQAKELLCHDVKTEGLVLSEEGIRGGNVVEDDSTPPEVHVSDKCKPNIDTDMDFLDENMSTLRAEHADQQRESGGASCFESVSQAKAVESMNDTDQYTFIVTGENVGSFISRADEEKGNNGNDALNLQGHKDHIQENVLETMADHGLAVHETMADHSLSVRDIIAANRDSAKVETSDGSCRCMDVVQVEGGLNQGVELCSDMPIAREECDYHHFNRAEHQSELQGASTATETLAENNPISDRKDCSRPRQRGCQLFCVGAHENVSGNSFDKLKATSASPSELLPDSDLLHQLSDECRQLKSLVSKLLVQNKSQSKVLCALGERFELLEHQQQVDCERNRRIMSKKRKSKRGSKRSVKFRNFE